MLTDDCDILFSHLFYVCPRSQVIEQFGEGKYLTGKTAIVTGGNSGIGLETCKALALAGCKVILCSRSVSAGEKAVKEEISQAGHGNYVADASLIKVKALDLQSLQSVKSFADEFLKEEDRLDFLVLNAGIMALPSAEYTEAGFEKQIGVNHFGHFYLTELLLSKMTEDSSSAGRIVSLSSVAHDMGSINCDDLHFKNGRRYAGWGAYGQSKLANILFAKELADRLKEQGKDHVTAVAVHPGVIQTNLWRASLFNRIVGSVVKSKNIPQGAATTVYACVAPRVSTEGMRGAYLNDCGPAEPTDKAQSKELRQQLWKVTDEQLKEAVKKLNIH